MCFSIANSEVDRLLLTLMKENPELKTEIQQLSKLWVKQVMSQPSKYNKKKPRSFEYSKQKVFDALKWRQNNFLLNSDLEKRIPQDGDPGLGNAYEKELNTGCFYW